MVFYPFTRGPGRRKKNPDFPPELLNSPFKHFKIDSNTESANESSSAISGASGHLVKPAIGLMPSNQSKTVLSSDENRDANNNSSNGEIFKVTVSQQANGALPNPIQTTFVSRIQGQHTQSSGNHSSRIMSPLSSSSAGTGFAPPTRPSLAMSPQGITTSSRTTLVPSMVSLNGTGITHSPLRSPTGEGGTSESSVPHVTSSGAADHADLRGGGNDTGSEVSASSPRLVSREVSELLLFLFLFNRPLHNR